MRRLAAGLGAVAVTVTVSVPVAWADAAPPLQPAAALVPGGGAAFYGSAPGTGTACTLGFLVHDSAGHPAMLSAGHCAQGGPVAYADATGATVAAGRVTRIDDPHDPAHPDAALVSIDAGVPASAVVATPRPARVTAVASASQIHVGDLLCHVGYATGEHCGAVLSPPSDGLVTFAAPARPGDSGGPVYHRNRDGGLTAVGMTTQTAASGTATVAVIAAPWVARWGLTVDGADAD